MSVLYSSINNFQVRSQFLKFRGEALIDKVINALLCLCSFTDKIFFKSKILSFGVGNLNIIIIYIIGENRGVSSIDKLIQYQ